MPQNQIVHGSFHFGAPNFRWHILGPMKSGNKPIASLSYLRKYVVFPIQSFRIIECVECVEYMVECCKCDLHDILVVLWNLQSRHIDEFRFTLVSIGIQTSCLSSIAL